MSKNKQFFQLVTSGSVAELHIYGDVTSWPWLDSDVSAHNLSMQLAELQGVNDIRVYINSYGGEVAEGLAIYNALKRHPAQVTTYCDGFACSIASVIFMAGDKRVMGNPSRLMIHDAWTSVWGANADELRKQADDLDNITNASVKAYLQHINITEEELRAKMKAETWITEDEALEMGFATEIDEEEVTEVAAQSAKKHLFAMLAKVMQADDEDENDEDGAESPEDAPEDEPEEEHAKDAGDDSEGNPDDQDEPEDDDDESDDDKPDATAQKWSGFFNALIGSN